MFCEICDTRELESDELYNRTVFTHGEGMERIRENGLITVQTTFDEKYQMNGSEIYDLDYFIKTENEQLNYIITSDNIILISHEKHFFMLGIPDGYNEPRGASSFYAGDPLVVGPIKCAGEIIKKDRNIYINCKSGTFRPRCINLDSAMILFSEYLVNYNLIRENHHHYM